MSDTVTVTFAAQTRNAALARTVAAAMAARADLPLDQLEDVRLAVDEAVSQLILDAAGDADICVVFTVRGSQLHVSASGQTRSGGAPDPATFSWTVLTALVDEVTATVADGRLTLDLYVTRQVPVDA